jgi:uncharacterized protein
MSQVHSYAPGTPNWVDLGSPDPAASATFYSELFGWQLDDPDPNPEAGGYRMARVRGLAVAGIGQAQDQSGPPSWTTYVSVEDADATAKLVEEAGGQVLAGPFDVMSFGRMAVFTDQAGAPFSVWQPLQHIGAEAVNEHGALTWNELHTADVEASKAFYGKALGWRFMEVDMNLGFIYTMFKVSDEAEQGVGGFMPMSATGVPESIPQHWKVYFAVDDCDAVAAKAAELGGTVLMEPTDMPGVGRMAICQCPHGEEFSIIKGAPPPES